MKKDLNQKACFTLLILFLFFNNDILAQGKSGKEKRFSDKVFFGGSLGMTFGNVTQIDILPVVGMWVIPQWSVGFGGRYSYRKEQYDILGKTITYKEHIWGISGFTEILPVRDLDEAFHIGIHGGPIFHGEWEGLYLDKGAIEPTGGNQNGKGWVHLIMVGAGYRFPLGEKAAFNLLVLWDLTNNQYSPYTSNPLLRISISF